MGGRNPAPVFLAMNFCGNHAIHPDPRIPLTRGWLYDSCAGCSNHQATAASRGGQAKDWPIEAIVDRGYALASFCNTDVDSDRADVSDGVYAWLARQQTGSASQPLTHDRGCIAGWAWGFHRGVDYLVTDPDFDAKRIAAVGHSRNGKTALLAAAFDERIAHGLPAPGGLRRHGAQPRRPANPGQARVERSRSTRTSRTGSTRSSRSSTTQPERLPFDQHCLVALMAPRPVLFSNAQEDQWANPAGQFEVLQAAEPVIACSTRAGWTPSKMPEQGTLVDSRLGYFIRAGKHSMTREDWAIFLQFAGRHFGQTR